MCGFQGTQKPYTISGDNGERDPPVPIPNTEVKPFSADGTWLETIWESRTLPDSMKKRTHPLRGGFFFHSICNVPTLWSSSMKSENVVEEHIPCHKGAYMGKNGITRDRTGKPWYYRNSKR